MKKPIGKNLIIDIVLLIGGVMLDCNECEFFDKESKAFKCDVVWKFKESECIQKRMLTEVCWIRGYAEVFAKQLGVLVSIFGESTKIQQESSNMQKQATKLFGRLGKMMKFAEKEMEDVQKGDEWKKETIDPEDAKEEIDSLIGNKDYRCQKCEHWFKVNDRVCKCPKCGTEVK